MDTGAGIGGGVGFGGFGRRGGIRGFGIGRLGVGSGWGLGGRGGGGYRGGVAPGYAPPVYVSVQTPAVAHEGPLVACGNCGHVNPAGARFCSGCGNSVMG